MPSNSYDVMICCVSAWHSRKHEALSARLPDDLASIRAEREHQKIFTGSLHSTMVHAGRMYLTYDFHAAKTKGFIFVGESWRGSEF